MATGNMAGLASGLRFHEVMGDNMEPTIRRRDYVLVAPVDRYVGEGYYLLSDPFRESSSVFSCSGDGTRQQPKIRLHSHLKFYSDRCVSKSYIDDHVLASVVMICHVVRPGLLDAAVRKVKA